MSFYAWCAGPDAGGSAGAVTIAYTNPTDDYAALTVEALDPAPRVAWALASTADASDVGSEGESAAAAAAPPPSLASDVVFLNGAALGVDPEGRLPAYPIPGRAAEAGAPWQAPPWSYGFLLYPAAAVAACI
jgi:hypothetical protein